MADHINEKYLEALHMMNDACVADYKTSKKWKYSNTKTRAKTFAAARAGNRLTNCVDAVQWALKIAGVPTKALDWYGGKGKIVWCSANSKANASQYFEIIATGGKTVKWLHDNNKLCDGDILLGYQTISHTSCYIGNGRSFDAGASEGAVFKKWIKSLTHASKKVNYILRLKDRAHYRVQVGAFTTDAAFNEMVAKLNAAGYKTMEVNEDGMRKIQCGYFSGKTNANKYASQLAAKGFPAMVVEATNVQAVDVVPVAAPTPTPAPAPQSVPTSTPSKNIVYRVQVGMFKTALNRNRIANNIKKKTGFDTFWEKINGQFYLFCGSFNTKEKAEERVRKLTNKKIGCFIKEWNV